MAINVLLVLTQLPQTEARRKVEKKYPGLTSSFRTLVNFGLSFLKLAIEVSRGILIPQSSKLHSY